MDYVKPKKNLRLKAMIVRRYGTQEDFALAMGIRSPEVSQVISNRKEASRVTKSLYANRLECAIIDIF